MTALHDPLALPAASKRAKSTSARDMRYGRQGGRWAHLQTDHEQAEAFAKAVEAGEIVLVQCGCSKAWVARRDAGRPCKACNQPMGEPSDRRWVVLDVEPATDRVPCPPTCPKCFAGHAKATGQWEYFGHAIGPCAGCGEPCRSVDREGVLRHPQSECGPAS